MLLLPCPNCGLRNASEFRWCGECKARPDPNTATIAEWRDYLYMRRNPADWTVETWFHRAGCRLYFTLERHRLTNEIRAAYPPAKLQTASSRDLRGLREKAQAREQ